MVNSEKAIKVLLRIEFNSLQLAVLNSCYVTNKTSLVTIKVCVFSKIYESFVLPKHLCSIYT